MINAEPIANFGGFGSGGSPSEYFYSQGMNKSRFGLVPGWNIAQGQTNSDLSTLGLINFFTQGLLNSVNNVVGVDENGYLYKSVGGTAPYSLFYKPGVATSGNGLIFDQKNRLLYFTQQYIGKSEGADYSAGTIAVTNGNANVVGTGTTFTAGMVGKQILIGGTFYTVQLFTDATHVTLNTNYAGSTASGLSYTIFTSFTDQYKDLGSANITTGLRPADTYEDWVVFPVYNGFAALNVQDDSMSNPGITIPTGFSPAGVKAGRTGILLGFNFNNRGVVALWDPAQGVRSIAPWIWFNANVKCIVPVQTTGAWIVITSRGVYHTNGYAIETIVEGAPDDAANATSIFANVKPQGAEIIGKFLAFWGTNNANFNRNRDGLYLLNLETKAFEFAPVSNGCLRGVTGGAIFFDNGNKTHLSYATDNPLKKFIGSLQNSKPSSAFVITEQLGRQSPNSKAAEGVKLTVGVSTRITESSPQITFSVTAKIYNFKRPLWCNAQTNALSGATNILNINGSLFTGAQVGDEVTIVEGVNAGQIRHITAIANQGTTSEQWTLDSALPNNTENTIYLSRAAFQVIKKQTVSNLTELRDLYFDIKNRIKGKKFLVKFLFENLTGVTPEMHEGYFIYDDLGLL